VFLDLCFLTRRSSLKISFLKKRGSEIAVAEEEEQRYREKERSDHSCFPGNKIKADERERETERDRETETETERGFAMRL
jgi:hypothetical protein